MSYFNRVEDNHLPHIYRDDFNTSLTAVSADLERILDNQPEKGSISKVATFVGSMFLTAVFPKNRHTVLISLGINAIVTQFLAIVRLGMQTRDLSAHERKLKTLEITIASAKEEKNLYLQSQQVLDKDIKLVETIIREDRAVLAEKQNTIVWNIISRIVQLPAVILLTVGVLTQVAPVFIAGVAVTLISYALSAKSIEKNVAQSITKQIFGFGECVKVAQDHRIADGYVHMSFRQQQYPEQPQQHVEQFLVDHNNPFLQGGQHYQNYEQPPAYQPNPYYQIPVYTPTYVQQPK